MYKNILMDFDGTLIDTNNLIILTLRETYRHFLGSDLTDSSLNSILGKILEEQIRYMSEDLFEEMLAYYKQFYRSNHDFYVKEFPGMRESLESMKNLGCKIAIVSSKGPGGIERGLKHFNLHNYIDAVVSANDVVNSKPHAEPALKAVEKLGALPEETLLVGDSPYDILCGKNAGIKTVLVDWSIFPREELLLCEPDFLVKTPGELVRIIEISNDAI